MPIESVLRSAGAILLLDAARWSFVGGISSAGILPSTAPVGIVDFLGTMMVFVPA